MKSIINFLVISTLMGCAVGPLAEFEQNLQKWQTAGISHYRMSLSVLCFCPFSQDMPVLIEVNGVEILSMQDVHGVEITRTDPRYGFVESYATIELLFSGLEAALKGGADEVSVMYDPDLGYPISINFDYIKNAVDDELGIQVTSFDPLPE